MRLRALVIFLPLVACQTYDFERVVPLLVAQTDDTSVIASKRLKPNVMLLVDKSGSMKEAIDDTDFARFCTPECGASGKADCDPRCPTRMSDLRLAMSTFLANSGTVARLGATTFPAAEGCSVPTNINVQLPPPTETDDGAEAALAASASEINRLITAVPPGGGTPTGRSLAFLGTYGGLGVGAPDDFRQDYVLLLTDGLPNCNDANPNAVCGCGNTCSVAQTTTCGCTSASCTNLANCSIGCLDQAGAVENVKALRQKGIRTIVVGFGSFLTQGAGPQVLNAMAREGGVQRQCPGGTDLECGGTVGSCDTSTKQCSTAFYQATNAVELAATLRKILEIIVPPNACEFVLKQRPSDERYVSVLVDDQNLTQGPETYLYDFSSNAVTFQGAMCARIAASTPQRTVKVEFRIVERF
ncbi:MAG: adventurous gliding motility lipoprotein CglB [Archangium sp.]|nr:adventurous gliding motility lipoprotein CglB [Archangium sp.]